MSIRNGIKKAAAKGDFAAVFLVKITKFTCVKHQRSSCRSLSPAVIQRHIVTTPTKPPTSVPAKNSSIKTPPVDSVGILEECYADKREHRKFQYTIFTVRAITARKTIFAAVKYAKYLPLTWGWLLHICL